MFSSIPFVNNIAANMDKYYFFCDLDATTATIGSSIGDLSSSNYTFSKLNSIVIKICHLILILEKTNLTTLLNSI
jgi:hypothetical protein